MIEIRVVGDSSSSGIGMSAAAYPYALFESPRLRVRFDFRIVNYSVPGLTSADAAALCSSRAFDGAFDCLIVYLGNNERACTTRKGVPGPWRRLLRRIANGRPVALRPPHSELEPFAFQHAIPAVNPNSPREFSKNLTLMIRCARRAGAAVILIAPIANARFPSGVQACNSLFFKRVGLAESAGRRLRGTEPESETLVRAIHLHDEGRAGEACAAYEGIAASAGGGVAFIARHNRATLLPARQAIAELRALEGAWPSYDPIVLYNLHDLYLAAGIDSDAARCLEESYERDTSSYRVTGAYRDVIREVAREHGLPVVDLADLLGQEHFVDYCHPTPDGHRRIAAAVAGVLCEASPPGASGGRHTCENRFVSPNSFFEDADLIAYYQIDHDLPGDRMVAALLPLVSRSGAPSGDEVLTRHLIRFLDANDAHPAFAPELDLLGRQAPRSHEVLRFPDFYLYRLLRAYGAAFEERELASRMEAEGACSRLLVPLPAYDRLILRRGTSPLDIDLDLGLSYLRSVEHRLRAACRGSAFANAIGERIKTIGVWYTREAMRYGTESRLSMLYDRWGVERMAEAVTVAAVIAAHNRLQARLARYGAILREMDALDALHARHAAAYHADPHRFSPEDYERDLARAAASIASLLGSGRSDWPSRPPVTAPRAQHATISRRRSRLCRRGLSARTSTASTSESSRIHGAGRTTPFRVRRSAGPESETSSSPQRGRHGRRRSSSGSDRRSPASGTMIPTSTRSGEHLRSTAR